MQWSVLFLYLKQDLDFSYKIIALWSMLIQTYELLLFLSLLPGGFIWKNLCLSRAKIYPWILIHYILVISVCLFLPFCVNILTALLIIILWIGRWIIPSDLFLNRVCVCCLFYYFRFFWGLMGISSVLFFLFYTYWHFQAFDFIGLW